MIKSNILDDIKDAMRAKDKERLATLRQLSAAFKQFEVDNRTECDDKQASAILAKLAKQRQESITQFEKAGRDDLIKVEQYELGIIEGYLPKPMSDADVTKLITEAMAQTGAQSIKDMGKVMAYIKDNASGRLEMGQLSQQIKNALNA